MTIKSNYLITSTPSNYLITSTPRATADADLIIIDRQEDVQQPKLHQIKNQSKEAQNLKFNF
jgi:hypothetical protein